MNPEYSINEQNIYSDQEITYQVVNFEDEKKVLKLKDSNKDYLFQSPYIGRMDLSGCVKIMPNFYSFFQMFTKVPNFRLFWACFALISFPGLAAAV